MGFLVKCIDAMTQAVLNLYDFVCQSFLFFVYYLQLISNLLMGSLSMKRSLFFLCLMGVLFFLYPPALFACEDGCDPADCPRHAKHHMESDASAGVEGTALDPICGMEISKAHAAAEVEYEGKTYYFCMEGEKEAFLKTPGKYLKGQVGPESDTAQ